MLLAIDIGNTNTVLGVFDGETLVEHWRIATVPDRTADEIFVVMRGLIGLSAAVKDADIEGISLCSTVPSVLHEMREMCTRYYADRMTIIVEPGVKTGVPIRYDNPKEVGSDRIMNSLAAIHLYGGPAIVVDFGTSTNFDAVSEKGEFIGGALAPGIEVSVEALARRAAQLLKVELSRPPHVIGKSTVDALRSGMLYGFAGQVEGIARRMRDELSPEDPDAVTVIATGGLAPLIIDEVPMITAHEPWLTLIGLRLVYERNAQELFGSLWAWLKKISRSRCVSGSASEKGCLSPAPRRIPSGSSGRRPRRNCAPNTDRFRPIRSPEKWRASPGG
jgi:type III pantothenate kinase